MENNFSKDEKQKIYKKEWRKKNIDRLKEKEKDYREKNKEYIKNYKEKNKESIKETTKKYRDKNFDKIKETNKIYKEKYKEKRNKLRKEKRLNDPLFRLTDNIRASIRNAIIDKGYLKETRTYKILGCSFEHFKEYIESFFIENNSWMNWGNYGNPKDGIFEPNKSWDIDHIIPLSSATNEEELLKLNHYTNLQPLCSYHNRFVKKDNY